MRFSFGRAVTQPYAGIRLSVGDRRLTPEQSHDLIVMKGVALIAHTLGSLRVPRRARILDAGCGAGALTEVMARIGFRMAGFYCSPTAIEQARLYGDATYEVGLLSEYRAANRFDATLCLDVLFHVIDDAEWLASVESLKANTKAGGIILAIEHFPEAGAKAPPHCRWRCLHDYEFALAPAAISHFDFKYPHAPERKTMVIARIPGPGWHKRALRGLRLPRTQWPRNWARKR